MKFGNKKLGLILGGVGLALTATGAGLLGAGTNATYSQKEGNIEMKIGIGSLNYGNIWVNGTKQEAPTEQSYFDAIKDLRKQYDEIKKVAESGDSSAKEVLKMVDKTLQANDMMISGAVLTSVFAVVLLVGAAMFFMNRKAA